MNIKGISTAVSLLAITESLGKCSGELTKADRTLASEGFGGLGRRPLLKLSRFSGLRTVKKSGADEPTINNSYTFRQRSTRT